MNIHTFLRHRMPRFLLSRIKLSSFFCLLIFAFSCPVSATDQQQSPTTMLFLPFTVDLPPAYAHLHTGLPEMLASRMTARTGIRPIYQKKTPKSSKTTLANDDFAQLTKKIQAVGANYVALGSISTKDQQYELTVHVFPGVTGAQATFFTTEVNTIDEIMDGVDRLSWDIAEALFDKKRPAPVHAESTKSGIAAFQTDHPEKAYLEGLFSSTTVAGLENNDNFTLINSLSSRRLDFDAVDMTITDLDSDGSTEIILAGTSELKLYQFNGEYFQHKSTIELPAYLSVHAITVADINGNGFPEIYVSANNRNRPSSLLLEWDGNTLKMRKISIPFYLRATKIPGKAPYLVGQAPSQKTPAGGKIYAMELSEQGTLRKKEQLHIPEGLNLFDFVRADITGDGSSELIFIDANNFLGVSTLNGTLLWRSSVKYGASCNYFGTKSTMALKEDRTYIPTRIVIHDINHDGTADVLIGRNRLERVKYMQQIRYWKGSSLAALTWKDSRLIPLWETRQRNGYIAGYGIEDKNEQALSLFFTDGVGDTLFSSLFPGADPLTLHQYLLHVNAAEKK
ncbi:MAG: hypothetical protein CSA34_06980 [Desulfobulbus propionicus]|nr:MAG: hypothetical protein CSA34_06980 [Desulfobulbus propionicus]